MTVGGWRWEAAEALKLTTQGNASGDAAMTARGWIRFSEALCNASQAGAAAELVPMLVELKTIRDERRTDAAYCEHMIGLLTTIAEKEQATQAGQDVEIGLMRVRLATLEHVVALLVESAGTNR